MRHLHEWEYEFEEIGSPNGFRGDMWCECGEKIFSREAKRMEAFGPIICVNPPSKDEKATSAADSAMFKVSNLVVERR